MKSIEIIDMHAHTFPDELAQTAMRRVNAVPRIIPYSDGTNRRLIRSMREAGVDLSVLMPVATNERQPYKLNEAAARINENTEETGLLSFGAMHPKDPNWKQEMKHIKDLGLKGIKLHPTYQETRFDDISYIRIVGMAAEMGLAVTVHSGKSPEYMDYPLCPPECIATVLKETQADKLIAAHMGAGWMWREAYDTLCGLPVYMDTAFCFGMTRPQPEFPRPEEELRLCRTEFLIGFIRDHGTDKVLFGSDSPWSGQKHELQLLRSCGLTEEELAPILGGNAKKILGISACDEGTLSA